MINNTDKEKKLGLMEQNTKVNINLDKKTVKAPLLLKMEVLTKANSFVITYMEKGITYGLTKKHIMEIG